MLWSVSTSTRHGSAQWFGVTNCNSFAVLCRKECEKGFLREAPAGRVLTISFPGRTVLNAGDGIDSVTAG